MSVRTRVVAVVPVVLIALANRAHALQIEKHETAVATPTYVALGHPGALLPDLACNDSGCLAVRIDGRSGTGVWGQRLRPDGATQDPAAFLLSSLTTSAQASGVATDGSRFMVAWGDGKNLYTTWVDPDESTSTQTVVMNSASPETGIFAIAHGDQGYLLTYVPGISSQVLGLRLDRDGHALDTKPFVLSSTTFEGAVPAVVWTGAQYLVVWDELVSGSGSTIAKGARVLADGTVLDPGGFMVTTLRSSLERPRLAWSGQVLMMVAGPSIAELGGMDSLTLDADGKNPHPFSLPGTGSRTDATSPDIAWNGTDFVITWLDGSYVVSAARVSASGTAVDTTPFVFTTGANQADFARLAVSAGTTQLIYEEVGDDDRLHGSTISATGSVLGGGALVDAASAQVLVAVGRGDGQTLIVWIDEANGQSTSLRVARVADDGSVLDATARVIGTSGTQITRMAGVAFGSGTYLVAWWDPQILGALRAARVSAAGTVLDATPILVANATSQLAQFAVGYDGQAFVVSWLKASSTSPNGPASAQRIGLDGTVLGNVFTIGPTTVDMTGPVLTTQNNRCIAAWGQTDFPPSVAVQAIGPGGAVGPIRMPAPNLTLAASAALVPVGTHLLLWDDRVGAIIGATDPFIASGQTYSLPRSIGVPTWDGMMFVAATPSVAPFQLPSTGIDVSVMGSDGTLAAPVTLTDRTLPVRNPTPVGLGNGKSLLVYSRLMAESAFGNYQVRFQILDTSPPGDGGTVLDAGMDGAADTSDGGVGLADGSPSEDLRADSPSEPIDARGADRGADAGPVSAGSGCSCAIQAGRGTSWASIAVALALLTVRRRRRSLRIRRAD